MVILGINDLGECWVSLPATQAQERRKEISNMETAHYIGADEGTNLVLIKEENNSWLSQSPIYGKPYFKVTLENYMTFLSQSFSDWSLSLTKHLCHTLNRHIYQAGSRSC